MTKIDKTNISFLLDEIAQSLDISDSLFKEAENRYQAIGTWLGESPSHLASFSPKIYPQGSFLLGTVTKPLNDMDDYDIDLVFELAIKKESITQKELKKLVGDRIKENVIYKQLLDDEGRRCWTLEYSNSSHFHLDILPAIPNESFQIMLKEQGISTNLIKNSIAITDNTLPTFDQYTLDWPCSNPKGYAVWFQEQMIIQYKELEKRFNETIKADIGKVPEFQIKTPLQRSIQLLKRHRDIVFKDKNEAKPSSIIITTLAAKAYNNQADLTEALSFIINGMPYFINSRNGISWVENPVNPSENFADRWRNDPIREPSFYKWINTVRFDMDRILSCEDLDKTGELLASLFGEHISISAIKKFKERIEEKTLKIEKDLFRKPTVVPIVHPLKPWGE